MIAFFIFQNITMFPYNYIWINNFSHLTKVQNVFELDYWSVSTKNVSKFIKTITMKILVLLLIGMMQ